jgi:DNA-binding transcriptional MerR regulator
MERPGLSIGEVARQAQCSVPSVRYYEQIGLLPSAKRRAGGHRVYGSTDLKQLRFIRRCRDFGFSVAEIRELLAVSERGRPCIEAREIAAARLQTVRTKLLELQALERSLAGFVRNCDVTCDSGKIEDCTLFDDIARDPAPACCG